ncbi:MAG TPA: biotin/lipoyl-containing protein [Planctomycetota bacterium]|jgi:acetyl-CoA carboxylase biotin carboxyl carrier protein|nr:biotin/lipoyl-containing protein [Planctomycetota bacterium]
MTMIRSNMAGVIVEVRVKPGDRIAAGQEVVVLESMKMQLPIAADVPGTVKAIRVKPGDFVNDGDPLLDLA